MNTILEILLTAWNLFTEISVYMLFGCFIAGILYIFVKPNHIASYLGKGKIRSVLISTLVGIPIPLCSCGVIPTAAGLKKQGANKGSALSFLIATPESGVDSIAVTYATLDPIMTVARPVSAFFTAITAGLIENFFGKEETHLENSQSEINKSCCKSKTPESKSLFTRVKSGINFAFVDLLDDISKSFIVGLLLAGIITYMIPENLTAFLSENRLLAMLLMLTAGIPMYVCATASTPIVAALILKGLNPGAALVFLLAGPATNMATMSMIAKLFGKRSLAIYLSSIVICSILMGYLVDFIYYSFNIKASAVAGQAAEIFPKSFEYITAATLALLLIFSITKKFTKKKKDCHCD